jgi:Domain of unknown function (DUF4173)
MDDSTLLQPGEYIPPQHSVPAPPPWETAPPSPFFPGAADQVEVFERPRPIASSRAWIVVVMATLGFMVCGATVFAGLAGTLVTGLLVCALIVSKTVLFRKEPIGWLIGAVLVSVSLMLRGSPWLITLNMIATAALLVAATLTARSGSLFRLTRTGFIEGAVRTVTGWLTGLTFVGTASSWLLSPTRKWRRGKHDIERSSQARLWRSLAMAAPILLMVIPLLRAGDAVFNKVIGKLLNAPFQLVKDLSVDGSHVLNGAVGLWVGLTLLAMAGAQSRQRKMVARVSMAPQFVSYDTTPETTKVSNRIRLSREVVGATWMLNAVLGLFGLGQIANVLGLASRLEVEVVSYNEIAKEGFFPLLAACAVVLLALICTHSILRERRWETNARRALQSLIALTLLVIAVASRRLWIGADIWGLTMLRVLAQSAAVLLAVVFTCLAIWQRRPTDRLPIIGVTALSATALLVALNVMPIETMIVRWNAARPTASNSATFPSGADALDARWGQGLGVASCENYYDKWHGRNVDGVLALGPLVVRQVALDRIDPSCARALLRCDHRFSTGGLRWNLARSRANRTTQRWCAALPAA